MKLAVDASSLMTSYTGVHVYIREILRALSERPEGPAAVALQPSAYPWKAPHPPAKVYNNLRLWAWIQWQLPRRARSAGCEVLLSPDFLSPRSPGRPKIVVAYDAGFVKRPEDFHPFWMWLWRRFYLPALRRADAIVTITQSARAEICEAFALDPARVTVIPPACDAARFAPAPEAECAAVLAKYGLRTREYLLHVGVMEKRKNLPALIRAFACVAAARPGVTLVLVGPAGPKADLDDSSAIAAEIRRLGLGDRVRLPGYLPGPDLPRFYQGALALVLPSRHEGFGIPVLEAFAAGTPVLCAGTEVLREVAQGGADYFDPDSDEDLAKVLERFLADPGRRGRLAAAGARRVAEFSWAKSARAFLTLAEDLAAPGGAAAAD